MVYIKSISIFVEKYNIYIPYLSTDDPLMFLLLNKDLDLSSKGFTRQCRGCCTVDNAIGVYLLMRFSKECIKMKIDPDDLSSYSFDYIISGENSDEESYETYIPYIVEQIQKLTQAIRDVTSEIDSQLLQYQEEGHVEIL